MPYLLKGLGSVVTQAELDELYHRFYIPHSISIRVPKIGKLPLRAYKEFSEITFPIVAPECRVRLSLAPFIRRLLSEFPLHPLQIVPTLSV